MIRAVLVTGGGRRAARLTGGLLDIQVHVVLGGRDGKIKAI